MSKAPQQLLNKPFVGGMVLFPEVSLLPSLRFLFSCQVDFPSVRQALHIFFSSPHIISHQRSAVQKVRGGEREREGERVLAAITTDQRHIRSYWSNPLGSTSKAAGLFLGGGRRKIRTTVKDSAPPKFVWHFTKRCHRIRDRQRERERERSNETTTDQTRSVPELIKGTNLTSAGFYPSPSHYTVALTLLSYTKQ